MPTCPCSLSDCVAGPTPGRTTTISVGDVVRIPSIGAPASPAQWCYWQGHPGHLARVWVHCGCKRWGAWPPLTGMTDAQLINWLRPVLALYLTDLAP